MKKLIYAIVLLFLASPLQAAEVVEIDVHGMTCGFCVDAVQRNLGKLPDVAKADVSLKLKKVRVYPKDGDIDLERVRKTIIDSGFTPLDSATRNDAQ